MAMPLLLTLSMQKKILSMYVKNQEEHHKTKTFIEELKEFLIEHKIEFDEKYLL